MIIFKTSLIYTFVALLIALLFLFSACSNEETVEQEEAVIEEPEVEEEEKEEPHPPSPYSGLPTEEVLLRPFAVIIDNHPQARPQSGLEKAPLVYEIIAEGEITRLLAIFPYPLTGNLGPIRSARPYFAHLARENDAVLILCGSSPHTKPFLEQEDYNFIDERPYPRFFQRDNSRKAPHNLYTDMDKLLEGSEHFDIYQETRNEPEFLFEEEAPSKNARDAREVQIPFGNNNRVKYTWNERTNTYMRYVNEQPHHVAQENTQIGVNNIIIQYVQFNYISRVHREYSLLGEGQGLLLRNGKAKEIQWAKESFSERTSYYQKDGSPVKLSPGNTWIHIVSPPAEAAILP